MVLFWNNRTPRGKTWLVIINKDGGIYRFQGTDIPGVATVQNREFKDQGVQCLTQDAKPDLTMRRGSSALSTTYTIHVVENVKVLMGDGPFLGGITTLLGLEQTPSTWVALGQALGVQEDSVKAFLYRFFPREAEELARIDPEPGITLMVPEPDITKPETPETRTEVQETPLANYVNISTNAMFSYESFSQKQAEHLADQIMICSRAISGPARQMLQKEILKKSTGWIECEGVKWWWVWSIAAPNAPMPPAPIRLFDW